ncbi:MAG: phosphate ABC transporter substrate-binding protein PstS [Candidatus Saccharimonadales bacterium]
MKKILLPIIAVILIAAIYISVSGNQKTSSPKTSQPAIKKQNEVITGAGSTFAAPLYGQLGSEYKNQSGNTINYQSVGSGAGIAQFIANTVNFGATDVALKDSEIAQATKGTPLNIPIAFGAVTVSYNVQGINTGLKLDGATIAKIYLGKITNWNDPVIAKLNPSAKLPDLQIAPIYRSDGSGTTAQFTEFLAAISPEWAQQVGSNKTVQWPTGTGAKGNDGVAAATNQTKGAIGYVELAYALKNKFTTAAVQDAAGDFVTPSLQSTSKAGENLPNLPNDLRFSAINSPNKGAYPIASATFAVVYQDACKSQEVTSPAQAKALQGWFSYLLGSGQNTMKQLQYAPLPNQLQTKAQAMVNTMKCNDQLITKNQ